MANYTEHYGLHQWVPEDDFLRTDFNTDFALIDAALAGLAAADASESAARSQEDGELSAAITAGDNAQATALASAKTALQNAITSGDNAQASALAAAKTALQNSITTGDSAQAAALAAAKAALEEEKAELIYGSYVGNGKEGAENAVSISFPTRPNLVIVFAPGAPNYNLMFLPGQTGGTVYAVESSSVVVTWTGNTVSWWSYLYSQEQFNVVNQTYYYAALVG